MSFGCWTAAILTVEFPSESSFYNDNDGDTRKGPNPYDCILVLSIYSYFYFVCLKTRFTLIITTNSGTLKYARAVPV